MQTADLLTLAVRQHQAGRLPEAEALYRRVLAVDANQPDALHLLGVLASECRQHEAALQLINRAIGINGRNPHYQLNLGNVLRELHRPEEALAAFQRALALEPRFALAHVNVGALLHELGRLEEAVTAYGQALALQPDHTDAHYSLAVALRDLGRLDEAIAELRRCCEIAPEFAKGQLVLAGYLLEQGEPAAALAACERCLNLKPRIIQALAFQSAALTALGKQEDLQRLLDLDRLIGRVRIDTPPGFADLREFNAALAQHVRMHPSLIKQPLTGATRHGSHTDELSVEPKGPIAAFEAIVNEAVRDYLQSLPAETEHPYLAQRPRTWRLTVWGVILGAQGYQDPHMHASGWVSGVYYARVPRAVEAGAAEKAGWIEFGRPPTEFYRGDVLELRTVKPEEGLLLLFPSYLYHRTIPYQSDEERISIAFDAIPEFSG